LINKSCLARKFAFLKLVVAGDGSDIRDFTRSLTLRKIILDSLEVGTPETFILQGLDNCNEAHSMLGEKGSEDSVPTDNSFSTTKHISQITSSLWDGQ